MSSWTDWVLCNVTAVWEIYDTNHNKRTSITMEPIGERNGNVFSFTISPNLEPPKVGDQFRFTPLQVEGSDLASTDRNATTDTANPQGRTLKGDKE